MLESKSLKFYSLKFTRKANVKKKEFFIYKLSSIKRIYIDCTLQSYLKNWLQSTFENISF